MMEEQWRQAQLTGDVAAMDRLLSDDYVGISMDGEISTKTQQLDRLRTRTLILTKIDPIGREGQAARPGRHRNLARGRTRVRTRACRITGRYRYTRVYQRLPSAGSGRSPTLSSPAFHFIGTACMKTPADTPAHPAS